MHLKVEFKVERLQHSWSLCSPITSFDVSQLTTKIQNAARRCQGCLRVPKEDITG
jgi:hypothetical protein